MKVPLRIVGEFSSRADVGTALSRPGDAALISRGYLRLLVLACPCGCGEQYSINLDPEAGKAWRIYTRRGRRTLFPSVWRDVGCKSHFIVWDDTVYLFGQDDGDELGSEAIGAESEEVLHYMSGEWRSFSEIAEDLDAIPWEILAVCRHLVRRGRAVEGEGALLRHFRLPY
jgi:hypothetical protein